MTYTCEIILNTCMSAGIRPLDIQEHLNEQASVNAKRVSLRIFLMNVLLMLNFREHSVVGSNQTT